MERRALTENMREALSLFAKEGRFGDVRSTTIKGLERRGFIKLNGSQWELTDERGKRFVAEQIDVQRPNKMRMRFWERTRLTPTIDPGQTDYAFWDKAHNGQATGLEIAGLFLKPLVSKKASWVLGQAPMVKFENEVTQEKFNEWLSYNHADVLSSYEEAARYGDSYMVVNAPDDDMNVPVTVVAPDVVTPIVDEDDYSQEIGRRIVQVYQHPTEVATTQTIIDEFTERERTRTIYRSNRDGTVQRFRNLIGRVPVIHVSNNLSSSEKYGRPEGQSLVVLMQYYGEVFEAALEGNIKMGRPTPVAQKLGDADSVDKFYDMHSETVDHTLPDGTIEPVNVIDFDSDKMVVMGGSGEFKYASPESFAGDTEKLLGLLFYMMLQHSEIPEFIWGNAISSSKASAESQLGPFVKWVEKNQGRAEKWLRELVRVVVGWLSLFEPGVSVDDMPTQIVWPALTDDDGRLTLEALKWSYSIGLIDRKTALSLAPLDIDNIDEVLAAADAENPQPEDDDEPFIPVNQDDTDADEDEPEDDEDTPMESFIETLTLDNETPEPELEAVPA